MGWKPVLCGAVLALIFSALVGILTFVAHRRLPYRKMLVLTGGMLGVVLLVMVGEQAQEMQLAHWIPTTKIDWLSGIPDWTGVWFSVYPTVETLVAQFLAALLVIGSYFFPRRSSSEEQAPEGVAARQGRPPPPPPLPQHQPLPRPPLRAPH